MSLITEDGTIVANAESYCTVAFADDYHSKRGNTAWDALDDTDDKEPALRKATEYMLQVYRARWNGARVSADQLLDWPRSGVVIDSASGFYVGFENSIDSDIVPLEVKRACAELALKASTATLLDDQTQSVLVETIGPISTTYDKSSPQATRYKAIDAMLRPYLSGSSNSARLVRV